MQTSTTYQSATGRTVTASIVTSETIIVNKEPHTRPCWRFSLEVEGFEELLVLRVQDGMFICGPATLNGKIVLPKVHATAEAQAIYSHYRAVDARTVDAQLEWGRAYYADHDRIEAAR